MNNAATSRPVPRKMREIAGVMPQWQFLDRPDHACVVYADTELDAVAVFEAWCRDGRPGHIRKVAT